MIIAINVSGTFKNKQQADNDFIVECFYKLAITHPEHTFIFIADRSFENRSIQLKSILHIFIDPKFSHPFLWQIWYNYKMTSIIKKQKADLFISLNGISPLYNIVPQFLLIEDLPVLHSPQLIKISHFNFYKKFTDKFLKTAKRIVTVSNFLKNEIVDRYTIDENKIDVIHSGINKMYKPLLAEEKEQVKEKYTDGKEYFLYAGDINAEKNLINLLKAFSFFKKRQKSNMQLIIVTKMVAVADFIQSLSTYKYRAEVKLLFDLTIEEQARITAAAYAFIYPSLYEVFPVKIIEAMQSNVPVIASNISAVKEIGGDAIAYINANSFEDIAEKMMLLFKDENKRTELIIKGAEQSLQYTWNKTAGLLWQSIIKTTPV